MGKGTKLKLVDLIQVPDWIDEGQSLDSIARIFGCTPEALHVKCTQLGIRVRPLGPATASAGNAEQAPREPVGSKSAGRHPQGAEPQRPRLVAKTVGPRRPSPLMGPPLV